MIIDLERVMLSEAVVNCWSELAKRAACAHPGINPATIPDEQGRLEDGLLTIFCSLPEGGEVSLAVPAGEWAWRQ